MTCSRGLFGVLVAAFLLAPLAPAATDSPSPAPTPIPTVQLKDGRVLHNFRVMADEGADVVVRADEGLVKVAKANLPAGLIETAPSSPPLAPGPTQYVMQRFDPNQAPAAPPPEPGAKANAAAKPGAPAAASNPVSGAVYRGCTIMSFQIKAFQNVQGCAEVIIRNDTDQAVPLRPAEVSCTTSDGVRHVARNMITGGFPPAVKKREFVPANGLLDDIFAFANEPLDISSVQWTR
jgi:hypothetical protein